jgi:hypothetical protein
MIIITMCVALVLLGLIMYKKEPESSSYKVDTTLSPLSTHASTSVRMSSQPVIFAGTNTNDEYLNALINMNSNKVYTTHAENVTYYQSQLILLNQYEKTLFVVKSHSGYVSAQLPLKHYRLTR